MVDTLGGKQGLTAITESGVFSLVLRSRRPDAKRFRKWLTSEVLPALRKTGKYSIPGIEIDPDPIIAAGMEIAANGRAIVDMRRNQLALEAEHRRLKEEQLKIASRVEKVEAIWETAQEKIDDAVVQSAKAQETALRVQVDVNHAETYVTVRGYCHIIKARLETEEYRKIGVIAGKICRKRGITIGKVPNVTWGDCNSYPREIVAEAYDNFMRLKASQVN